ncbi:hypothetical protein O1L68_38200 [Streptomyces lydicus]|nr:hypothetical protein [Streptomyces lydicus]
MACAGFGTALTMPASTAAVMEAAPGERSGAAAAVFNAARQIGSALGVALFGTLVATGLVPGLHTSMGIGAAGFLLAAFLSARCIPGTGRAATRGNGGRDGRGRRPGGNRAGGAARPRFSRSSSSPTSMRCAGRAPPGGGRLLGVAGLGEGAQTGELRAQHDADRRDLLGLGMAPLDTQPGCGRVIGRHRLVGRRGVIDGRGPARGRSVPGRRARVGGTVSSAAPRSSARVSAATGGSSPVTVSVTTAVPSSVTAAASRASPASVEVPSPAGLASPMTVLASVDVLMWGPSDRWWSAVGDRWPRRCAVPCPGRSQGRR